MAEISKKLIDIAGLKHYHSHVEGMFNAVDAKLAAIIDVMHFRGVVTKVEGKEFMTAAGALNEGVTLGFQGLVKGDVILYGSKEYVYDGSRWYELGDQDAIAQALSDATTKAAAAQTAAEAYADAIKVNGKAQVNQEITVGAADIEYKAAAGEDAAVSVSAAIAALEAAVGTTDVNAQITAKIKALDVEEAPIAVKSADNVITIHGISETDGKVAVGTKAANDVVLAKVAATGAASDVALSEAIDDTYTKDMTVQAAIAQLVADVASAESGAVATAAADATTKAATAKSDAISAAAADATSKANAAQKAAEATAAGYKTTIDAYTVNGKAISGNPVLAAGDIKMSDAEGAKSIAAEIGTSADAADADTIYGKIAAVAATVSGKNVDAEGDDYVTATAANNKVTVSTNVASNTDIDTELGFTHANAQPQA